MKALLIILSLVGINAWAEPASFTTVAANKEGESILADSFARTLYVFDVDQGSNTSKCAADCAEVWPPFLLTATEAAGLQAPLGTIARANKKLQLTFNGRPVYTYMLDRQQGDDRGDGIGGVWHYIGVK